MASRSTFRPASDGLAWQKQLRDRHLSEGTPDVPHRDVKRAEVRPVSRHLAQQVIYKYEWLGTMAASSHHYGIFFGDYCAGVCCVAVGSGHAGTNAHKMFHVEQRRLAILTRGACVHWAPLGANSKLVAWTCRLTQRATGAKIMLAYSDTDAGEIGTIYQAANWVYIGRTGIVRQVIAPNGRIYDEKLLHDWGKPRGMNKTATLKHLQAHGWTYQYTNAKHRYVYVLDRTDHALLDRIERMRQPYPKRHSCAGSVASDTAVHQTDEGGAIPTPALQAQAVYTKEHSHAVRC